MSAPTTSPRRRLRLRDESGLTLMELLVGLVIMSIVSTMVLMGWFAIQNSYSYTINSSEARDFANQALARMELEIRDAEAGPSGVAIIDAEPTSITFTTTFNLAGATDPNTQPVLTEYYLRDDPPVNGQPQGQSLWRVRDDNGNGTLTDDTPVRVVKNVVNCLVPEGAHSTTDLFTYGYYSSDGAYTQVNTIPAGSTTVLSELQTVQIHLLVDLNPEHSPIYMDLQTTAQPRDQRPI